MSDDQIISDGGDVHAVDSSGSYLDDDRPRNLVVPRLLALVPQHPEVPEVAEELREHVGEVPAEGSCQCVIGCPVSALTTVMPVVFMPQVWLRLILLQKMTRKAIPPAMASATPKAIVDPVGRLQRPASPFTVHAFSSRGPATNAMMAGISNNRPIKPSMMNAPKRAPKPAYCRLPSCCCA